MSWARNQVDKFYFNSKPNKTQHASMHSYLLLQEQQKNATVLIRWTSFFHETIGLTAHNRVVSALRDTCHMRSMKIYTLAPVHRIACNIQLSEFLAHEIALRYIHNLHHHRHHHHQNIICFCVAHFIRTFVTFFFSLFSVAFFIRQRRPPNIFVDEMSILLK